MSVETVKALLELTRVCAAALSCAECPLKEFCGKAPENW